jgi:hypothetical protein
MTLSLDMFPDDAQAAQQCKKILEAHQGTDMDEEHHNILINH